MWTRTTPREKLRKKKSPPGTSLAFGSPQQTAHHLTAYRQVELRSTGQPRAAIPTRSSAVENVYCPVSRKIGFCAGGWLFAGGIPAPKGAGRFVISVSATLPPRVIVFVVVLIMATDPASQTPT